MTDADNIAKQVSEFYAQEDAERTVRLKRELAHNKLVLAELRQRQTVEAVRQEYRAILREQLPALDPPELEVSPPSGVRPAHTWIVMCSDWHIGQKTELAETGALFEQSTEIATRQVADLAATIERLHRTWSPSIDVERIVLLGLGDLVEGDDMRNSQHRGIDRLVVQQALETGKLFHGLALRLMRLAPRVSVRIVGGNHDRTSRKPSHAGLAELGYIDSYSWLIGGMLEWQLERAIDRGRADLRNSESFFDGEKIAGLRAVWEHGCSFRTSSGSYGGIGYYPIANAARKYQQMLDGADLVLMGHFHQPNLLNMGRGWQVLNGALPASTPFVQGTFKSVGRPSQTLLDLHPTHGLVGWHPLYLDHPGVAEPGAFWTQAR